jgi:hypothetical protein
MRWKMSKKRRCKARKISKAYSRSRFYLYNIKLSINAFIIIHLYNLPFLSLNLEILSTLYVITVIKSASLQHQDIHFEGRNSFSFP